VAQLIRRDENVWLVRVFLGRDADGKRRFNNKTIRGSKKAAQAWARDTETKISMGDYCEPTKQTIAEFLNKWLDGAAAQRVRPRTLESYRKLIANYVIPAFGDRKLSQLRLPEIEKLYTDMRTRGLSPRTVRYTHSVLRTALKHAARARLLSHNPTDYATLPRHERTEMQCLDRAEAFRFLAAAENDRYHALWELLAVGGLRPGEALGVKWGDISGSTITVQRALVAGGENWQVADTKTAGSRRSKLLVASTVKALQTHRRRQAEEKLRAGVAYRDNGFVFVTETGLPLDIQHVTRQHFHKVLKAAGIDKKIRLYDLRHTAATLMGYAGFSLKEISEQLGHSTIRLTADTYSHVLPDMKQEGVRKMELLLAGMTA
jgi:integrase